jgi:hypothetical protein
MLVQLLRLLKWLLSGYLLATSRLLKGYLIYTDNIVSISNAIAYKCPILADLRDRIDHKKTFT